MLSKFFLHKVPSGLALEACGRIIPIRPQAKSIKRLYICYLYDYIEVKYPSRIRKKDIESYIYNNFDGLKKHFVKVIEGSQGVTPLREGEILYRGKIWKNIIDSSIGKNIVKDYNDLTIKSSSALVGKDLLNWYKQRAIFLFPQWIDELSNVAGYTYSTFKVKRYTSVWGRCDNRKNICINIKLALTPDFVIKGVLAHELVHTVYLNHSRNFWDELNHLYPLTSDVKKWLRKNSLFVKLAFDRL